MPRASERCPFWIFFNQSKIRWEELVAINPSPYDGLWMLVHAVTTIIHWKFLHHCCSLLVNQLLQQVAFCNTLSNGLGNILETLWAVLYWPGRVSWPLRDGKEMDFCCHSVSGLQVFTGTKALLVHTTEFPVFVGNNWWFGCRVAGGHIRFHRAEQLAVPVGRFKKASESLGHTLFCWGQRSGAYKLFLCWIDSCFANHSFYFQ